MLLKKVRKKCGTISKFFPAVVDGRVRPSILAPPMVSESWRCAGSRASLSTTAHDMDQRRSMSWWHNENQKDSYRVQNDFMRKNSPQSVTVTVFFTSLTYLILTKRICLTIFCQRYRIVPVCAGVCRAYLIMHPKNQVCEGRSLFPAFPNIIYSFIFLSFFFVSVTTLTLVNSCAHYSDVERIQPTASSSDIPVNSELCLSGW